MTDPVTGAAIADGFLTIEWFDEADGGAAAPCPNCGAHGTKPRVLDVTWIETRKEKTVRRHLYECPACTCRFFGALKIPPYHDGLVIGWPELHAQQGAGLWSIDSPLARIKKPAASRYLEIGCGYGFALDFARHARGWQALGIDPAPLAELGCGLLGADLREGYFPEADPYVERDDIRWDIMVATEVIEHLAHPAGLLRDMRTRLADDGVLLLTTPDGEAIRKETGEAALAQLLAPELHMVFQTSASLTRLLREAGFPYVALARDVTSLVAFASPSPLDLGDDLPARRRMFLDYLAKRSREIDPVSDLGIGFAGRAMAEAVNDGDFALAAEMRGLVWRGIGARFHLDLDRLDHLPPEMHNLPLQRLRFILPFNLSTVLFAEAMRRLGQGAKRAEVRRELALAAEASGLLIRALAPLSLNDGMTEEIAWQAQAELVIADAEAGDAATSAALRSLPRGDAIRHRRITWRALIALVNAGAVEAARSLAMQEDLREADDTLPVHLRRDGLPARLWRDTLLVLGQLALAEGGDPLRAVNIARQLGDDPAAAGLLLGGFTRLVNASRFDDADALRDEAAMRAASRDDETSRDARLALAVLDLAAGDPARVPTWIERLEIETDRRAALLLGAFTRLVNTSRYREALDFAAAHDSAGMAMARADDAGRDARLALAVLDLAAGDPAMVPSRIDGLEIEADRRGALLLRAFTRLVNAARYDDAKAFSAAQDIAGLAMAHADDDARDARLALAVLDLAAGDPAMVPSRIDGLAIEADQRGALLLRAFTRLVNAARYDDAKAFSAAQDIARLAMAHADDDARDARLALAVLDLAAGDPATVPSRIDGLAIEADQRGALLLRAFTRLVNATRYDDAKAFSAAHQIAALAMARIDDDARDARLAFAVLDLAAGDPTTVPSRIDGLAIEAGQRNAMLLRAFTRLVNATRYDDAKAFSAAHQIAALAMARIDDDARDARLAFAVLDLAAGDPARVPDWIDGLNIKESRQRGLILGAFTRLVNASRFEEASVMALARRVAELAAQGLDEAGRDARLALAVLDLAIGDPALVPARLEGLEIEAARRRGLILGAFTRLINKGRYDDAKSLRDATPVREWTADTADAAGADAAFATVMLELAAGDPALVPGLLGTLPGLGASARDELLLQAFLRLVQKDRQDAARELARDGIEDAALRAGPDLRDAALTALILLDINPPGVPARIARRLDEWEAAGLDPAQVRALANLAFVSLVNGQRFDAARTLSPRIEPGFANFAKADTGTARNAGYALGVLHLQEPAQPHRAEAAFSAVRRGYAETFAEGDAAPSLFWEALRGEMVALHQTKRGEEAAALGRAMLTRFHGAPDDLVRDFASPS